MTLTVIKVGGSLFDLPDLGGRLRALLSELKDRNVLIVPGGGAAADVIRELDRIHQLGEEASHWLAIGAMSQNARFLHVLMPELPIVDMIPLIPGDRSTSTLGLHCVLDAQPFFRADEARVDHLPHRWDVTSDSLAVRVAHLGGASELILLKSVAWKGSNWAETTRAGIADGYFPEAMRRVDLGVRVVNLRTVPPVP